MDNQQNPQLAVQKVTSASIASKFKSKHELHFFLTVDCALFVPREEHCTM